MRSLVILITCSLVAAAQFVPDRYIVELTTPPSAESAPKARAATRKAALDQQSRIRTELRRRSITELGSTQHVANTLLVQASDADIAAIRQSPEVRTVHRVRLYRMQLDRAATLHRATEAWARLGTTNAGAGVKIAIIDSGVDSGHPGLQDSSLTSPPGFPKADSDANLAYTNSKVIVARSYASLWQRSDPDESPRDRVGHGTALAMAAAGVTVNAPLAQLTGMAPRAWIGNYKVFGSPGVNDGATDAAILKAIDDAVADGMDIINLSFGTILAPPAENDVIVQALARAEQMGVMTVVAVGNDGSDANTVSSPADAESAIAVGAMESDRTFAATLATGDGRSFTAQPAASSSQTPDVSGQLAAVSAYDQNGLACGALPAAALSGRIALILRGTCTFEQKLNNAERAGAVAAVIYNNDTGVVIMNTGAATLPASMISQDDGTAILRALTDGTSLQARLSFIPHAVYSGSEPLADFSSRGPAPANGIKPDLVSLGTSIYTATQTLDRSGDMYDASGFTVVDGTSFSAPIVAGAAALVKSARPGLSPADYRSLLINSAQPLASDPNASPQQVGAGMLDVIRALDAPVVINPVSLSFGAVRDGDRLSRTVKVRNVTGTPVTLSLRAESSAGAAIPALSESKLSLAAGGTAEFTVSVAGNSLPGGTAEGTIFLQDIGTQTTARLPYWFAKPSDTVASIAVLYAATSDSANRTLTEALFFRVLDPSGMTSDITPTVTVVSGTGSVSQVMRRDEDIAGAWGVRLRLGSGVNRLRIRAGDVERELTIRGR